MTNVELHLSAVWTPAQSCFCLVTVTADCMAWVSHWPQLYHILIIIIIIIVEIMSQFTGHCNMERVTIGLMVIQIVIQWWSGTGNNNECLQYRPKETPASICCNREMYLTGFCISSGIRSFSCYSSCSLIGMWLPRSLVAFHTVLNIPLRVPGAPNELGQWLSDWVRDRASICEGGLGSRTCNSVCTSVRLSVTRVDCVLLWHQQWLVGDAPFPLKSALKVIHPLRETPTSADFRL